MTTTEPPADEPDAGPPAHPDDVPPRRRRRPRRAARAGTNPRAEDLPDVVAPREPGGADETPHDRWLREQRPPHWE